MNCLNWSWMSAVKALGVVFIASIFWIEPEKSSPAVGVV